MSLTEHLLYHVLDRLDLLLWQNTGKKTGRPKPNSPAAKTKQKESPRHWGKTDRPAEEVAELLAEVAAGKWSVANLTLEDGATNGDGPTEPPESLEVQPEG